MKKILIGLVAVLAVGGAGLGVRYYMHTTARVHAARMGKGDAAPRVTYVDVKQLTLRLADPGTEHYIRIAPVLAVRRADAKEVERTIPVVRDRIVTVVTACTSTQLVTPQGVSKLKHEMLAALRKRFGSDIVGVYFNEYLVE